MPDDDPCPTIDFLEKRTNEFPAAISSAIFERIAKDKAYQVTESEKPEGRTELIVYWCHSVERGPKHRVFDEDDIQAAGGINGLEMELQRDSCWFVQLGVIEARRMPTILYASSAGGAQQ